MFSNWHLEGDTAPCAIAVVIPALGEGEQLWATLASVAENPQSRLRETVVVVVINSRADSAADLVQQNLIDLEYVRCHGGNHARDHGAGGGCRFGALRLAWVDATTPQRQLPVKNGGVGLARKIGCELVLAQLAENGILVQLDADTLVDTNYLSAIAAAFAFHTCHAAVIPYRHQNTTDIRALSAINHYELYMRCHTLGLALAGSPYAYHSIGSTIACRKQSYLKAGGMNCRSAGEDFYFLQQLAKTSGVGHLRGTVVRPAARISQRTPFGTGQVIHQLCHGATEQLFYAPQCYLLLRRWLELVAKNLDEEGAVLLHQTRAIDMHLAQFVEQQHFVSIWQRLCATHRDHQRRLHAFHEWFDALKTLRCIKYLSTSAYPMASASDHVPPLLHMAEITGGTGVEHWLQILQKHDGADSGP